MLIDRLVRVLHDHMVTSLVRPSKLDEGHRFESVTATYDDGSSEVVFFPEAMSAVSFTATLARATGRRLRALEFDR